MSIPLPPSVRSLLASFPVQTHPPVVQPREPPVKAELWVSPPLSYRNQKPDPYADQRHVSLLSADIECLKWQAYIALRLDKHLPTRVRLRFDIAPEGALEGRLPNLHTPSRPPNPQRTSGNEKPRHREQQHNDGDLLSPPRIPAWVDAQLGEGSKDPLSGFKDRESLDEMNAWVSLLEKDVHLAIHVFGPQPSSWDITNLVQLTWTLPKNTVESTATPTVIPSKGISSVWSLNSLPILTGAPPLPPKHLVLDRYKEAISALSIRLGTSQWFLDSSGPTALDALLFAYLHAILHGPDKELKRLLVKMRNLVEWEDRLRDHIQNLYRLA